MKLVEQSAKLLKQEFGNTRKEIVNNAYKHAAICAGICYSSKKTYDDIDEAKYFVNNVLIKNNHFSPLAHATCYLDISYNDKESVSDCDKIYAISKDQYAKAYINVVFYKYKIEQISARGSYLHDHLFIETNLRFIIEHNLLDEYNKYCVSEDYVMNKINPLLDDDQYLISPRKTVIVETSRVIATEFNRHAANMAICGMSTRYCNLSNTDKFGDIKFIKNISDEISYEHNLLIDDAYTFCEQTYCKLIEMGLKPEMARSVLPLNLYTQLAYTANMKEWEHIFDLRINGTTGKPHPDAKDLAMKIREAISDNLTTVIE